MLWCLPCHSQELELLRMWYDWVSWWNALYNSHSARYRGTYLSDHLLLLAATFAHLISAMVNSFIPIERLTDKDKFTLFGGVVRIYVSHWFATSYTRNKCLPDFPKFKIMMNGPFHLFSFSSLWMRCSRMLATTTFCILLACGRFD